MQSTPKSVRRTSTGCRPAQLLGPWMMEAQAYDDLYVQAAQIISSGQLEVVAKQSREMAEEDQQSPYELDNDGVAHMSVNGVMTRHPTSLQSALGGTSTLLLQRAVRLAANDNDVKGMMLHINSPGGTVDGINDISNEIARFRTKKPVAAHVGCVGCSAAYRLAIEADHISMDPMGTTGSVGVLGKMRDSSKLMERAGIKDHYIGSGDRKATGQAGTVVTEQQLADEQQRINEMAMVFTSAVRGRRTKITPEHMNDVTRAGVYGAQSALSMGLVDSIADTSEAISQFKNSLSTGSRSLPVALLNPAAAQQRSSAMALTPEQLTQAKALPGCGDISAENADGKLLAAAMSLQTDLSSKSSRMTTLESELATAKAGMPEKTPASVLKAMASASRIHLKDAVAKQAITPAVAEALASSLIGTDDMLSAVGLTPSATGECVASAVFAALASNGAAPNVGKEAGGQAAPKVASGAPEAKKPITPERKKELLAMSGAHVS